MKKGLRDNSLSIALFGLFFLSWILLSVTGVKHYNQEQEEHGEPPVTYTEYITTSSFWEATTENWESEFLQMFSYVVLTIFLFQRGSAESKDPDKAEPQDRDPRKSKNKEEAPGPVRKGGFMLTLYENSLSLAFLLLFLLSFLLHLGSGAREYSQQQVEHGEPPVTMMQYLGEPQFWFESFQNWQSEFLAIGMMVVLSIYLRQRGSSESKPVDSPHSETGKG